MNKLKILMVNVPFSGHVNPTLPLAKELVSRGHEVSYILNDEWKERIEQTGAKFIPYTNHGNFRIKFKNGHPSNIIKALQVWKYAYNTIVDIGKDYDILIFEFFTFVAYSAAVKAGIKAVRQFSTFAINSDNISSVLVSKNKEVNLIKNKFLLKIMTKMVCGKIKLSTENIITEITDIPIDLNIVYTSKAFQVDNEKFDKRYCFVGPSINKRCSSLHIPYDKMNDTVIYISLGTLQNENMSFYKKCMEAFGNNDKISVIMSVGKNINIQKMGHIPENFFVYNFVPQLEVLEKSDVFITHGGMNSVNEGLYFNNKFLVVPMDMDQYIVADRVEELKLGYKLKKEAITSDLLQKKLIELLSDDEITECVQKISTTLHNAGGVKKAAEYIEEYAKL